VALQLSYFSKVSVRLRFIQQGQAACTCKKKAAAFWVYCLSLPNGWKCCRYLGISNQVAVLFFMAVSIRTARLLLLYALAKKNLVYFIFMAVSIRAARLLLLYALAKKT
jgi:hypothetical protein